MNNKVFIDLICGMFNRKPYLYEDFPRDGWVALCSGEGAHNQDMLEYDMASGMSVVHYSGAAQAADNKKDGLLKGHKILAAYAHLKENSADVKLAGIWRDVVLALCDFTAGAMDTIFIGKHHVEIISSELAAKMILQAEGLAESMNEDSYFASPESFDGLYLKRTWELFKAGKYTEAAELMYEFVDDINQVEGQTIALSAECGFDNKPAAEALIETHIGKPLEVTSSMIVLPKRMETLGQLTGKIRQPNRLIRDMRVFGRRLPDYDESEFGLAVCLDISGSMGMNYRHHGSFSNRISVARNHHDLIMSSQLNAVSCAYGDDRVIQIRGSAEKVNLLNSNADEAAVNWAISQLDKMQVEKKMIVFLADGEFDGCTISDKYVILHVDYNHGRENPFGQYKVNGDCNVLAEIQRIVDQVL